MYQNVTVETFIILQKVSISDKNCSSKNVKEFWKKVSVFTKNMKQEEMFLEHQISMISEGSWDTGYWSNDAENSVLHHRNE